LTRKPIFPRFIGLLALYSAVLVILVMIQFTGQGNFTFRIGNMVVSGQYKTDEEGRRPAETGTLAAADNTPAVPDSQLLEGEASIFFGGLEFRMSEEADEYSLVLIDYEGNRGPVFPQSMRISGETVTFFLPGGTSLFFNTQYIGGRAELRISGDFAENAQTLELSYRLLKSSRVRDTGDSRFYIIADGADYSFNRPVFSDKRGKISVRSGGPQISYGAVPGKKAFSPGDFILEQAQTSQSYNEELVRWRDRNFSLWNRVISSQNDEDMVVAYAGEAVKRGNYKAAVSAAAPAFLAGNRRTHKSSVYLGRMDIALRSFTSSEQEKISRLSRTINVKSLDFLKETHVFEFLAVRGLLNFINDGMEIVRAVDPAALSPEFTPGIFEGYEDIKQYRSYDENPFERLTDQACFVLSEGIKRIPLPGNSEAEGIFVFWGSVMDTKFNLRLGNALRQWAEDTGNQEWAAVGRSLVLSVLSLADNSGTVPPGFTLSEDSEISEVPGERITTAKLYRIFNPSEYYPRGVNIGSSVNGIWTFTSALSVSAAQEGEGSILDISVSFPVGETHYMMIRGVKPFTKIQLYNIDFRTDPQFERYDSSGWVYSPGDQILVLKMKHRTTIEHIRIYY
jgi:hypothetical protein